MRGARSAGWAESHVCFRRSTISPNLNPELHPPVSLERVEYSADSGSLNGVRRTAKVFAFIVLALWALATTHCALGRVSGLDFLAWCEAQESSGPGQENGCAGDSCCSIEKDFYRAMDPIRVLPPSAWVISPLAPLREPTPPPMRLQLACRVGTTPALLQPWQFAFRTALPPRAPSPLA
jgi:hypothetical protein